jgi:hypothetical protein
MISSYILTSFTSLGICGINLFVNSPVFANFLLKFLGKKNIILIGLHEFLYPSAFYPSG